MRLRRRRAARVTPPLQSMSDIAFLLLIFIMLVGLINYRREVAIDYAEAAGVENTSAGADLEIWIDGTGAYHLEGVPSGLDELEAGVAAVLDRDPDTRVHLIADRAAPFERANSVLDLLKRRGHRLVSLVVKDETAP